MQTALALLLSFLTAKSRGLQNITHQRPAWMENLTPLSRMSQRRRSTNAALVFSWIFVWIFVPALFGGAFSQPLNQTYVLRPCQINESLVIVSVTWGKGPIPTDITVIAERNRKDKDEPTNEHFSVDKEYRLVIKNTTPNDMGIYWCQVTPRDTTGYSCSKTLEVEPETRKPVTRKPVTKKPGPMYPLISSAEQTFIQCQVLRNLCLLSGVLTIWLTNVGGVG